MEQLKKELIAALVKRFDEIGGRADHMAAAYGVNAPDISNVKRGHAAGAYTLDKVAKMAEAFGLSIDFKVVVTPLAKVKTTGADAARRAKTINVDFDKYE